MKIYLTRIILCILTCVVYLLNTSPANAQTTIAAAANIRNALEEISVVYQQNHPKLQIIYGGTGTFYQQILSGANFQILMAADQNAVDQLAQKNLTKDMGIVYVRGKLVMWIPKGQAQFSLDPQLIGFKEALQNGKIKRIAIANPTLAPYGLASKQTLEKLGIWNLATSNMVQGENVGQTAQFAISGSVEVAFLPLSLVLGPELVGKGEYVVIPASFHEPILQKMVRLKNASSEADDFYQFLQSSQAREVLKKYGYD